MGERDKSISSSLVLDMRGIQRLSVVVECFE
jgi:hypothetical protein